MQWADEGYLLSKNNYNENSIIIEAFTLNHGKYTGIVYGGSSRKQKKNFQIGNKILLNWKSKSENRSGYFSVELLDPISPFFFDDKKRSISILSAASILKILLPDRQLNEKIYLSFQTLLSQLHLDDFIKLYIYWELSLIKDLGFDTNYESLSNLEYNSNKKININQKSFKIPKIFFKNGNNFNYNENIKEGLIFNKNLLMENFIIPNKLKFPLHRLILEKYYN